MGIKVIIWDNDGTIVGAQNPLDTSNSAKIILPNVSYYMNSGSFLNIICSGCKTPESEKQNFDPQMVVNKFKKLMETLPIHAAAFSPAIGGTECFLLIKDKDDGTFRLLRVHEEQKYQPLIGEFKKPGTGMLVVIYDWLRRYYDEGLSPEEILMIGDTWHDREAAVKFGIHFLDADYLHKAIITSSQTIDQLFQVSKDT